MENIEAWVGTMSSAANRPFRHTATAVSLCIVSELASLAADAVRSSADFLRMSESERKKKSVNKGRLKELEDKSKASNSRREKLDEQINSWFETVFLHRSLLLRVWPKYESSILIPKLGWGIIPRGFDLKLLAP